MSTKQERDSEDDEDDQFDAKDDADPLLNFTIKKSHDLAAIKPFVYVGLEEINRKGLLSYNKKEAVGTWRDLHYYGRFAFLILLLYIVYNSCYQPLGLFSHAQTMTCMVMSSL
eukprot:13201_1